MSFFSSVPPQQSANADERPLERPAVQSLPLNYDVQLLMAGFNAALGRKPKLQVTQHSFTEPRPHCVSIPISRPKLRTLSLTFSHSTTVPLALQKPKPAVPAAQSNLPVPTDAPVTEGEPEVDPLVAQQPFVKPKKYTRLKPPKDLVKLEDRLFYVLQPPLETWAAGSEIHFPFKPFPYQFEGIAFLYPRYAALLADEMGLGKTMQTISAIRLLLRAGEVRSVLLVCPKPLVFNWQREFAAWAPEIPICTIEGDQAKRKWQWMLADAPLKLANYELLQRDKDLLDPTQLRFDLVIIDEAQRIKNSSSTTAAIVRSIGRKRSWALTGTPVENRPDDLVGIFEFLSPGYLQPNMKMHALGQMAGEFILRRTKDKVLTEMPPKLIRDEFIELGPQQWDTYRLAEDTGVLKLNNLGHELTIQHVFELVLRLKQICNFDPVSLESTKLDRLEAELEEVAASGQKALVFSQWTDSIDKMAVRLKHFNPLQYHGGIPHKQRPEIIDRFKAEKKYSVMLMSYGAGSVGLNLQFATYVFLFDRWWNPAIEDQAINRAHRIGAAGPVTVTRFIASQTVEERIDKVLCEKREMFEAILSGADAPKNLGMNRNEIFGLFNMRCPQGKIDIAA